jgi:hypothetical protein
MFVVCLLNDAQKFKIWQVHKPIKQNCKAFIISNVLLQDLTALYVYMHTDDPGEILPLSSVCLGPWCKTKTKMQVLERDDSDGLLWLKPIAVAVPKVLQQRYVSREKFSYSCSFLFYCQAFIQLPYLCYLFFASSFTAFLEVVLKIHLSFVVSQSSLDPQLLFCELYFYREEDNDFLLKIDSYTNYTISRPEYRYIIH